MRPGVLLTDRDVRILDRLRRLGALTTEQVCRLGFPSRQTALRRLRRLASAGLIRCSAVSTLPVRLVTLTPKGGERLPGQEGAPARIVRKLPGPLFLRHLLAVNDLRLALEEGVRDAGALELVQFVTDRDRLGYGPDRQPVSRLAISVRDERGPILHHLPDAGFVLRREGRTATFYAELDLGTETIGDPRRGVGKIMRTYLSALAAGQSGRLSVDKHDASGPRPFRVLFITTSEKRLSHIRGRWGALDFRPEAAKRFVWLGTLEALRGASILKWPWVSLDPSDSASYAIVPGRPGVES